MVAHRLSRRAVLEMAAASGLARGASRTRLLLVTGGHEFDASFWAIFKDHPEWKMEPRAHEPAETCTVYDRPVAPDFDAVLLYDMPRSITDVQQQHFLALFERGVGAVVLHHLGMKYYPQGLPPVTRTTGCAKISLDRALENLHDIA